MQYSPKLKKAMEEIKPILEKYDIGGFVILADGNGHSEFLNKVEASWSPMVVEHTPLGAALRFKVKAAEVGKEQAEKLANKGYNLLTHIVDNLATHFKVYRDLKQQLSKHIQEIGNDPGSTTSHQEQNN